MNAVIQSRAHPPMVLEGNRWTTQSLQDRLPAYNRCMAALGAQLRSLRGTLAPLPSDISGVLY